MSGHDPLCAEYFLPFAPGFAEDEPCMICCLIRRVREDEAAKYGSLRTMHDAIAKARAAALRDAAQAVEALPTRGVNGTLAGWDADKQEWVDLLWVRLNDAVAAIEALGGES